MTDSGFSSWVLGERERMNAEHERHRLRLMRFSAAPYPDRKCDAPHPMERRLPLSGAALASVESSPRKTLAQRLADKREEARYAAWTTTAPDAGLLLARPPAAGDRAHDLPVARGTR